MAKLRHTDARTVKTAIKDAISAVRFSAQCHDIDDVLPVVILYATDGNDARTACGIDLDLDVQDIDLVIKSLVEYRNAAVDRGDL
jgi:hypothetical protein